MAGEAASRSGDAAGRSERTVPREGGPKYPVGSVDTALRMLILMSERAELRVTDASQELGVGRSTAHRIMQMLEYYGFVVQNPATRGYTPGPVMINAGLKLLGEVDVREVARPFIERLAIRVSETVHLLSLRLDGRLVCLDSVEGPQMLRVGSRTGQVLPSHNTAAGHALLARLPRATLDVMFPDERLEKTTESSIGTRTELDAALAATRQRGYGVSRTLHLSDICGVGVAVETGTDTAQLAVGVAIPASRYTPELEELAASEAALCAAELAAALRGE